MYGYKHSRKDRPRKATLYVREQQECVEHSVRTDANPAEKSIRRRGWTNVGKTVLSGRYRKLIRRKYMRSSENWKEFYIHSPCVSSLHWIILAWQHNNPDFCSAFWQQPTGDDRGPHRKWRSFGHSSYKSRIDIEYWRSGAALTTLTENFKIQILKKGEKA